MILDTEKQNCANCKNWSGVTSDYAPDLPRGRKMCVRSVTRGEEALDPKSEMWGQDGSDYYARAVTLPTFSCAMWEAKR